MYIYIMVSQWSHIYNQKSEHIDFKGQMTYMTPYLMNHYLRKYLITIWCVLFYRRHQTFDVKTCFQQNRYVFEVIVTSWALFVFCISWNFARDIWTVFEEIKHCFSNIKTSSKRLEYLNIFPSFFKKFNTSWNQKNTLTIFVFYLF
jgi:hypothetical protein